MSEKYDDSFEYPDGTRVYPLKKLIVEKYIKDKQEQINAMHMKTTDELVNFLKVNGIHPQKERVITVDELIKLLLSLSDSPIYGRVMFFKELFLLYQELKKNGIKVQDPKFVPYYYGPYSFLVAETLELMEATGQILREGKKNTNSEKFEIKNPERDKFALIVGNELFDRLKKLRKGWDQLGTEGILRFVYQNYPKYKTKSKIKDRYKTITWGRGKG